MAGWQAGRLAAGYGRARRQEEEKLEKETGHRSRVTGLLTTEYAESVAFRNETDFFFGSGELGPYSRAQRDLLPKTVS